MTAKKKPQRRGNGIAGASNKNKVQRESKSVSTAVQLAKLLARLRARPHHTYELRQCGISHPAGRVLNLIEQGYAIESARVTSTDPDGFTHHGVALYSLIGEPEGTHDAGRS